MFPWGVSTKHSGTQRLCDKVILQEAFLFALNKKIYWSNASAAFSSGMALLIASNNYKNTIIAMKYLYIFGHYST